MREARWSKTSCGFTLIEVLVATAVLSILLVLLLQVSDHTLRATQTSQQQISATKQSRAVLDSLESDLSTAVLKYGLSILTNTTGTNTVLAFLTNERGPSGASGFRCAAIAYDLATNRLQRRFSPVAWDDRDLVLRTASAAGSSQISNLATGILRFEAVAELENGDIVPLSLCSSDELLGETLSGGFRALNITDASAPSTGQRVVALIVAVAAVDEQNLALPGVEGIAAKLASPSAGETPMEVWRSALADGDLDSIPRPALAALRMTQQTFPLP